jgi:hypothetical protein
MPRPRAALALIVAAPVSLYAALAGPVRPPAPTFPDAYFPAAVGAEWVYRLTDSQPGRPARTFERVQVVTAVTARDGAVVATVAERGDYDPGDVSAWAVSRAGLLRRNERWGKAGPWLTLLRGPVVCGETWAEDDGEGSHNVLTVAGCEAVRVPAGLYRATRVDMVQTHAGRAAPPLSASWWYAPGVGCVKLVVRGTTTRFVIVMELTAFKPGRE